MPGIGAILEFKVGTSARAIVVGGGNAGLMATAVLAEAGVPVLLVSRSGARRAGSVLDRSGFLIARGDDASRGAPTLRAIREAMPGLLAFVSRLGVAFDRKTTDGDGETVFAGTRTGQEVHVALDQLVRKYESEDATDGAGATLAGARRVVRLEGWTLRDLVKDSRGAIVGAVVESARTLETRAVAADGVVLATGGITSIFGRSTSGACLSGTGSAVALRAGAVLANADVTYFHPTCVAGDGRGAWLDPRLLTAGGRLWLPRRHDDPRPAAEIPETERNAVFEHRNGEVHDLDAVSRTLFDAAFGELGSPATHGSRRALLDLDEIDLDLLRGPLHDDLALYRALTGDDPNLGSLEVWPAAHQSMGGLWVDTAPPNDGSADPESPRSHATTVAGLYACGEADSAYRGATVIRDLAMGASLFGARRAARAVVVYRQTLTRSASDLDPTTFEQNAEFVGKNAAVRLGRDGDGPSPFELEDRLGELMTRGTSGTRDSGTLDAVIGRLDELEFDRGRARLVDRNTSSNRGMLSLLDLGDSILLARAVAEAARLRLEASTSSTPLVRYVNGSVEMTKEPEATGTPR